MKTIKRSCNQCNSNMISVALDHESIAVADACIKPECPNYGLLQVPAEILRDYFKGLKKGKK